MITRTEIQQQKNNHAFDNIISLGYFCGPAMQLEKHGFRRASYPFDWLIIRNFELVLQLLKNGFEGSDFLTESYFSQAKIKKNYYQNIKTKVRFLHDFDEYHSLESQFKEFSDKYQRRMNRLQNDIQRPTLFIRYIGDQDELNFIEHNNKQIDDLIKRKCPYNEIIYVCDNHLNPSIDIVVTTVRSGVVNFNFLEDSNCNLLSWLRMNYSLPLEYRKKKRSLFMKMKKVCMRAFRKKYTHSFVYDDLD